MEKNIQLRGIGDIKFLVSDIKGEVINSYGVMNPDGVAFRGTVIIDLTLLSAMYPLTICRLVEISMKFCVFLMLLITMKSW